MNTEDFVTYEQAVRLKELGFDWGTQNFYVKKDSKLKSKHRGITSLYYNWNASKNTTISSPTLAQVAKWLREKHNLFVDVYVDYPTVNRSTWAYDLREIGRNYLWSSDEIGFNSYEKALSEGIDAALARI